jgi:L-threonylcarbamoyladenylate synthase
VSAGLPDPIGDAVTWLRGGGLLAYPTETVWGLGADARREDALERLSRWKGRAEGEPVSILVAAAAALEDLEIELGPAARVLTAKFWPGPLTLVLPGRGGFARGVARADGAIGVRCSSHPLASALARRLRAEGAGPITATSLNESGAEPARSREEAESLCGAGEDAPRLIRVERADAGGVGVSTVLDLTGAAPEVLRWGLVSEAELAPVLATLGIP